MEEISASACADNQSAADAGVVADNGWQWWAGRNEEWFQLGPFATRGEAVEAGLEDDPDGCWITEALSQRVRFSAERLIDEQYYEQDEWFSPDHGSDPDRQGASVSADEELQALLDAWAEKWQHTFVAPSMFAAQRGLEWVTASTASPDKLGGENV